MKTLVVGLGNLGGAIATRLARTIHVIGIDQDVSRRTDWAAHTQQPTEASLQEIDWDSDIGRIVIAVHSSGTALSLVQQLQQLSAKSLTCHIVTTLDPSDAQRLTQIAEEHPHVRILEQPVSGGASGAQDGSLTVLSAGPLLPEDRAFLLDHLCANIWEFEQYGLPTFTKLINNTVASRQLGLHAWALQTAQQYGITPQTMHNILQSSSGGSTIVDLASAMHPEQGALLDKDVALLTSWDDQLTADKQQCMTASMAVLTVHQLIDQHKG